MEPSSPYGYCQEQRKQPKQAQAGIEAAPTPCNSVVSSDVSPSPRSSVVSFDSSPTPNSSVSSFQVPPNPFSFIIEGAPTPNNSLVSFDVSSSLRSSVAYFKVPPTPCNSPVSFDVSSSPRNSVASFDTSTSHQSYMSHYADDDKRKDYQLRMSNLIHGLGDTTASTSQPPTLVSPNGYNGGSETAMTSSDGTVNTGAATYGGSNHNPGTQTQAETDSVDLTPPTPCNTVDESYHEDPEMPGGGFTILELGPVSTFHLSNIGGSSGSRSSGRGRDPSSVGDEKAKDRPDNWSMAVERTDSKVDTAGLPPIEHGDVNYSDGFVTGFPLACLMIGIMVAQFLISIDRTIISTAIPYITHEFHSTPHIGWYGSAYLLTACAFQPFFGRIFMLFSIKKAYLLAMFLFEVGSLLCGVAPNSITLIIGRAIAGLGSAGILTGSFVVVGTAVPLRARPMLMAIVGTMFGVGATTGPLLGGVFTDLVSWRWCFYVNLPIGAATVLAMLLFFHPKKNDNASRGFFERVLDLDMVGNILLIGSAVMLFLALESTTQGDAWGSVKVIGLFAGAGVVAILFTIWQRVKGDGALMPPRIVMQRTVAASCGMAFMIYAALINLTFFLPVWFQAIRGVSAMQSGINMIPYFVVNAVFSLAAASFVSKVGYVTPPAIIGSAIGTFGLGLMTILRVDTTTAQWAGFQVLTAAGFGISIQQGFTAVQTVLEQDDIPIAIAAVVAAQSLGGAIFLSVGNSVFQNQLLHATAARLLDDIDIKKLIDGGAASFRHLVPAADLPEMLQIYNKALTTVFTVSIPLGGLATLISCFIQWRSVKSEKPVDSEEAEMPEEIHPEEVKKV